MKLQKGFTLVELMVATTIMGLLVAIALPNFSFAQNRAEKASMKANMHILQTALENYAIDWRGQYPERLQELKEEAELFHYWSSFKNPFTKDAGLNKSMRNFNVRLKHVRENNTIPVNNNSMGMIIYDTNPYYKNNPISYAIYAVDSKGLILSTNGEPFFLDR